MELGRYSSGSMPSIFSSREDEGRMSIALVLLLLIPAACVETDPCHEDPECQGSAGSTGSSDTDGNTGDGDGDGNDE